ncbi:MAG: hypothetical protein EAZ55_02545 [Cytophagales bacterium]|nr:MAG: hypothetical protein EAZ55_02545 [Cytophagales bacterium]
MAYLSDLHKLFDEDKLIFLYKGDFNQPVLIAVHNIIKNYLNRNPIPFSLYKRLNHLAIELIQNIIKHNAKEVVDQESIFMFGKENNKYLILSGNTIPTEKKEHLEYYLDYLNHLTSDKLKIFYKKSIQSVFQFDRKGKMGLIEMAIKSANIIQYEFSRLNEKYSYFTYLITIDIPEANSNEDPQDS